MADKEPGAVVRRHFDAFSAGDLDGMLSTLAPDATFVSGTTLVDPATFGEFFGWAIRELSPTMRIETLLVDGDGVACQFVESISIDGERKHLNRAAFYRVTDGLIVAVKVYDERD